MKKIRNFSIVAHIDHGKSTLSDRLIEYCRGLNERQMKEQVLDSMDIERERGITIKAQTVRLKYKAKNGGTYFLNFMDTPGHVDFSYEVSRSLAACEGSILVVDSTQGVEAQTLANVYKALDNDHEIIIALNKIDLASSDIERTNNQIEDMIGLDTSNAIAVSAKTGQGIEEILEAIIKCVPNPEGDRNAPLQALLVDSWYDIYLGIVILIRVKNGIISKNSKIRMMSNDKLYQVESIGIFTPTKENKNELGPGEIGFITANIKNLNDCKVGDTITLDDNPCSQPLSGFKPISQVVFCSIFPVDAGEFDDFREGLNKLQLNDSSFSFEMENSSALGYGFRCGFLGLLHLDVIQERLRREFDLEIITTAPSVVYKVYTTKGEIMEIHNPGDMPNITLIERTEEPWVKATIMLPDEYMGTIISLCMEKRGEQLKLSYNNNTAIVTYAIPLSEIIMDFYDRLKSLSKGYASVDWEIDCYKTTDVVKLTIMINSESVDAMSFLIHKDRAYNRGKEICERLKDVIPRQQYKIAIQAAIGSKIIARETINAYRKDVTAKLYGGDVTRRMKLLEKQKKGKKRMQSMGKITIPPNAFVEALKLNK